MMKKHLIIFVCVIFIFTVMFVHFDPQSGISKAVSVDFPQKDNLIIIDPGHGGFDGGALSQNGIVEKNINLNISKFLADYLEIIGYKVIMTRETDISLEDENLSTIREKKRSDIYNRLELMKKFPDAIFVSIHQNFYTAEKYSGIQVFYSKNEQNASCRLAESIQNSAVNFTQNENTRKIKQCGSSVYLIDNATIPAVLVECGFLSNINEANKLNTVSYQKDLAYSVALGISDYFNS